MNSQSINCNPKNLFHEEEICFSAYTPTRFTIDHSPGWICARALFAVTSSSINRR